MTKPSHIKQFISALKDDPELRKRGFALLAKRDNILDFFDEVVQQGLVEPHQNPKPIRTGNAFQVPFWEVLTFLEKAAAAAADANNPVIVAKIKEIILNTTEHNKKEGFQYSNFHTWHSFTKILALFPPSQLQLRDVEQIEHWCQCGFDASLVVSEISKNLIPKLLQANEGHIEQLVTKIVSILLKTEEATARTSLTDFWGERRPRVESYWLQQLTKRYAKPLGERFGGSLIPIVIETLEEVLTDAVDEHSYIWRPAIEDHPQNHRDIAFESILISFLRDLIHGREAGNNGSTRVHIENLVLSKRTLLKRTGWHAVDVHFKSIGDIFWKHCTPQLFKNSLWHELYLLIQRNFSTFPQDRKEKVFSAITAISVSHDGSEAENEECKDECSRDWLSAIVGKGSHEVDAEFERLNSIVKGRLSEHPDFLSYSETVSGYGPSPFTEIELVSWNYETFVEKCNAFTSSGTWRGPTYRSLCDAITAAAQQNPNYFLNGQEKLLKLKPSYKYGIVNGLRNVDLKKLPGGWKRALAFCEGLLNDADIWRGYLKTKNDMGDIPNEDWLLRSISDLVDSGVRTDEKAFEAHLLPQAKRITLTLITNIISEKDPQINHPMDWSINTTRGRALELWFDYVLRAARIEDEVTKSHDAIWKDAKEVFEKELSKCKGENFEFSTLCGAYLPNLYYLNKEWLMQQLSQIFPGDFPKNLFCALHGFSYTGFYRTDLYLRLRALAFLTALDDQTLLEEVREKIVFLATIAYIRGDEGLHDEGGLFSKILAQFQVVDLGNISFVLWHDNKAIRAAGYTQRVFDFWDFCVQRTGKDRSDFKEREQDYKNILSNLGRLTTYLQENHPKAEELIFATASFIEHNHNGSTFIEGLLEVSSAKPILAGKGLLAAINAKVYLFPHDEVCQILSNLIEKDGGLYVTIIEKLMDQNWAYDFHQKNRHRLKA